MGDLSASFSRAEFRCPCGECKTIVSPALVERLQCIRDAILMPIRITSGYRCPAYNDKIGGEKDGSHTTGEGVDVMIPSNHYRYLFLQEALRSFLRIGIYDRHVHVDVSAELPSPRCWIGWSK
jgi:uncharacterized protein YcbK (DUF882 family)